MCVVTLPVAPFYGSIVSNDRSACGVTCVAAAARWKHMALYADPAFVRAPLGGVGQYKMGW